MLDEIQSYILSNPNRKLTAKGVFLFWLEKLHPSFFSLVMATGIISIGASLNGLPRIGETLFVLNFIFYFLCWLILVLRIYFFKNTLIQELQSSIKTPGFFSIVAATGILSVQCYFYFNIVWLHNFLFFFLILLWSASIYPLFVLITINKNKSNIQDGMNGGWLLAVVATQSLVVFGMKLFANTQSSEILHLFLLSLWLFGVMLYIWIITLVFYRYFFFNFSPTDLMPPYWINMGAMAISTLAGVNLLKGIESVEVLVLFIPFIRGITILCWATAMWWIPMLFLFGFWRHFVSRVAFTYSSLYWALVFPLGMFSVATLNLNEQFFHIRELQLLGNVFFVFGLVAWSFNFFGLGSRILFLIFLYFKKNGGHNER